MFENNAKFHNNSISSYIKYKKDYYYSFKLASTVLQLFKFYTSGQKEEIKELSTRVEKKATDIEAEQKGKKLFTFILFNEF